MLLIWTSLKLHCLVKSKLDNNNLKLSRINEIDLHNLRKIVDTVIPLSIRTEKNHYFFLCPKTKGNVFHTVRKFRESLMPIICQKVSIPKYTV